MKKLLILRSTVVEHGRFADRGDIIEAGDSIAQNLINEGAATGKLEAIAAREAELAPKTEKKEAKPKTEKKAD